MELLPGKQNFDLDKSRQKFHHSLKEHHKISNIPKFLKNGKLRRAILSAFYNHFATKHRNINNFVMFFQAVVKFLSRFVEIKILVIRQ
jgi:hypothetical protein